MLKLWLISYQHDTDNRNYSVPAPAPSSQRSKTQKLWNVSQLEPNTRITKQKWLVAQLNTEQWTQNCSNARAFQLYVNTCCAHYQVKTGPGDQSISVDWLAPVHNMYYHVQCTWPTLAVLIFPDFILPNLANVEIIQSGNIKVRK